jgi:hypothetical protein
MAGALNHLKQAIQDRVVPLLIERGFHLYSRESGIEIWHFRRSHEVSSHQGSFDALDLWFSGKREKAHHAENTANVAMMMTVFSNEYIEKVLREFQWRYLSVITHTHRVGINRIRKRQRWDWLFRNHSQWESFSMPEGIPESDRKGAAEDVADEIVAVLPQVDAWFKDGTLGPNLDLTIIPLKFAE